LTDALLGVLYPHYLAPVPSMAVVQFDPDPVRLESPDGFRIERHSTLRTPPLDGLRCRYRTGYPVVLWPIAVTEARLLLPPFPPGYQPPPRTKAALRLQLECTGPQPFPALNLDRLRLHLFGEDPVIAGLYELLFNHGNVDPKYDTTLQVVFRPLDPGTKAAPIVCAPRDCLSEVGFGADEGLLPYPRQSFLGYRLLTEYFAFPSKFLFLDLGGFARVRQAGFQRRLEVLIYLDRTRPGLEQAVDASTFRPGCTPAVNLFEQTAEAVPLTHTRSEYRLVPDVGYPLGLEVFSVESVTGIDATRAETTEYQPFYSFRHGGDRGSRRAFWYAGYRPEADELDRGRDLYLSLVNLDFEPQEAEESSLVVRTLCTNRDLPVRLQQTGDALTFELEQAAPLRSPARCLRTPTLPLRPPVRRGAQWRLISHLSLNHLSLTDPVEGRAALQEILSLYDFSEAGAGQQRAAVARRLIEGIVGLSSRPVVGRTGAPTASGYCRGTEVTIEFDEQKYVDTGLFLFASVLERFLALYASVNSFSQLAATTSQRRGLLKKWPPRAGEQPLL
jgi:type VI secretion system protein ImpG